LFGWPALLLALIGQSGFAHAAPIDVSSSARWERPAAIVQIAVNHVHESPQADRAQPHHGIIVAGCSDGDCVACSLVPLTLSIVRACASPEAARFAQSLVPARSHHH